MNIIFWVIIGLVAIVAVKLGTGETIASKIRSRDFIVGINPIEGQRIFDAILKYRRGFPVAWLTALIYSESYFDRLTHDVYEDKGLGQLTPIALREIERVYGIEVDESRIFEIEYNVYLTGLFAERSKGAARLHSIGKYDILYATILTYKDWLTWTDWTHVRAKRAWETYQGLKHNYLTHNYESERI